MKLSRRKFFGAAAGAAVAPTLAQPGDANAPWVPGPVRQIGLQDVDNWLWEERARLEATAHGETFEHHEARRDHDIQMRRSQIANANIDALRSVSAPVKQLMAMEHSKRAMQRSWVDDAKRELRWLLKRNGL